jgi:ATP phosphoribosyltransferase regulatory subunit
MTQQNKTIMAHWMLPEGFEEVLPERAQVLEQLRRRLLDHYAVCGYEQIMTPFVEYTDALLAGSGQELDAQTFRVTDSMSGRQMGLRADMTLQAARIDAHQIHKDVPVRLCYMGTVLRARSDGFGSSRAPLQIGAELYGHDGVESDLEILQLMLDTLRLVGVDNVHIDLGHVGIFRSLVEQAGLDSEQEQMLFEALQRKAVTEISTMLASFDIGADVAASLSVLADLNGGIEVLDRAAELYANAGETVQQALADMRSVSELLKQRMPDLSIHFDLAELRGYAYQTGLVFAAFVPGHGQEVARGGRYNDIGSIFGRARPATGFSADLKQLIQISSQLPVAETSAIYAPAERDPQLDNAIAALRERGERVIIALPGQQGDAADMQCDRILQKTESGWQVVFLDT